MLGARELKLRDAFGYNVSTKPPTHRAVHLNWSKAELQGRWELGWEIKNGD